MSSVKRIGVGARMSEAVVHGTKMYTSGIVADDAKGKSVFEQTTDILKQIDGLLEMTGSNKKLLLKANIWLTDISTFDEMNKAWDAWVVPEETPVRATVETKLAVAGCNVEIMIEAGIENPNLKKSA